MDADVAQLVREARVIEAAELASARGDARSAASLFERACDWQRASTEALRAGDTARALELAARAGDEDAGTRALTALAGDSRAATGAAARLDSRGLWSWAARAWEAGGRPMEAARSWEKAGDALRAARLLERGGEPARAVRVLDAALRRDPSAAAVAVALGTRLVALGRHEAAVRVLQRVPGDAPERADAAGPLADALTRMGFARAAAHARAESGERRGSREAAAEGKAAPLDGARVGTLHGAPDAASLHDAPDAASLRDAPDAASLHGAPDASTLARERLFGRYEIEREVASSAAARVLACFDPVRRERVAVKLWATSAAPVPRASIERARRESGAIAAIDHPHVVPVRAFIAEGPAFVFAWMEGGTLDDWRAEQAVAPARAAEVTCAILSALGEAHRHGVVHRDLKPSNVFFDASGTARVADFGAAHLADVSVTATAGVFGTLAYTSPEQREGRPATSQSDLYAAGVLLREMLTGIRPAALDASVARPSLAHPALGAAHDALVDRLTAARPEDRPGSAFDALRLVRSLRWPGARARDAGRRDAAAEAAREPALHRLLDEGGVGPVDAWTGRTIELVPLDEPTLARARAFALAGHPALQTVLRVDREGGSLWLDALPETPFDGPLAPAERAQLAAALSALAAAGGRHGRVDRDHLRRRAGAVVLRFPRGALGVPHETATDEEDLAALARL